MVRNILQDLNYNSLIFFSSSSSLPNTDVKDIVPSTYTITREIGRQAKDVRECLAISPYMWKDKFKQNSYRGLIAHYAVNLTMKSINVQRIFETIFFSICLSCVFRYLVSRQSLLLSLDSVLMIPWIR